MNLKTQMEKVINNSYTNIGGLKVLKKGETVYEKYYNDCSSISTIHIASVTKSIISALYGIAIEQGYIKSLDQKVLDFFPDYTVPKGEKTAQLVTIKDMLTMTVPYKYKTEPYVKFFTSDNWMKFALDLLGGKGHIGDFLYAGLIGSHLLSGILTKATGQPIIEFANKNLFLPLGIDVPNSIVFSNKDEQIEFIENTITGGWAADPQNINTSGWGLKLTTTDMAKIGQLYLNKGIWDNKQIVPSSWVDESTHEHSRCKQWGNLAYGYLWWIIDDKERVYAAMGDGGNMIYINEKKDMVIAIASLYIPKAKDKIKLVKDYIEPVFED